MHRIHRRVRRSHRARRIQSVSVSGPDDWFTAPVWHDNNVAVDPGGAAAGPTPAQPFPRT
ncbi:hypothetical protein A7U43_28300 (plasmid) [Mycobacterium adipatum]|uniref:Uncharacterized protein n=1 Tax=Mycobacterium adipatum TaxID=1682113 RepID=A0A172UWE7_9MYCO|nr:hypothetical protein A7U43_28300 [Mycobacterium adipatum]